ncbi:MAG TPA: arginine deiminase family protein [Jiangellaceae bacterium]|nr:arginine deiminase family protein [Jiangellaceae bacterium]
MNRGTALVRRPSSRLSEGIVTHIARTHVDIATAERQHEAYRAALSDAGWTVQEIAKADDYPDSVFVEDTVVVCDDLAVLTRPGAAARRAEVDGTEAVVRALGLEVVRIEPPGTLDGGDVLQVGSMVYVGRGGRTNDVGIRQLARYLTGRGRNVVTVALRDVLHLKSAVTALPDGSLLAVPALVDTAVLPPVHAVDEEAGCHVVPLGDDRVLIAASAPRTAAWLVDQGFTPAVVDIAEYEKLEGCVTCLSVLIPDQAAP